MRIPWSIQGQSVTTSTKAFHSKLVAAKDIHTKSRWHVGETRLVDNSNGGLLLDESRDMAVTGHWDYGLR